MAVRRRWRFAFWIGLAAATVGLSLAAGFVGWTLDPAFLQPRLIEAVQRATGRTLTIAGETRIKLSLVPTVSLTDVALSNPPGASRPEMVKVARVELGVALLPLLRHRFEIEHVTLSRPDVMLETDRNGTGNWLFRRPPSQVATPTTSAAPVSGGTKPRRFAVAFADVTVVDGHLDWIDGKTGRHTVLDAPRLGIEASEAGPVTLSGVLNYRGQTIGLSAHGGPPKESGSAAWPVAVKLEVGGGAVSVDGQIARTTERGSYQFSLTASLPDPSVLAPLLPALPVGSLGEVTAHADGVAAVGQTPTISSLRVVAGSVDLDRLVHGLRLNDVVLTASDGTPMQLTAQVEADGGASRVGGTVGDLAWLTAGASGSVAVDLSWTAGSAHASVKGTIQAPTRFAGFALDVAADVPDPSLVLHDAPAALKSLALWTHLTDSGAPVPFRLTSNAGDLTGNLTLVRLPPPSVARIAVAGQIASQHLDLDILRTRAPAPAVEPVAGTVAPPTATQPVPPPADTKLPFDLIRTVDAQIGFTFADVRLNGADLRHIDGKVSVNDGRLRLDPFSIAAPDQRLTGSLLGLTGSLLADATTTPPSVHVSVDAPGLAVQPLLGALGLPEIASGTVQVRADLTGAGDSPRAIGASLDGWAGVAVDGGTLDARMLNASLGRLPVLHVGGADITELRCFAARAEVKSGVATIQPMALNTPVLIVEGDGDVDLGRETLSLRLRPRGRIGGTGIALPIRVSGPIAAPSARIDISGKGFGGGLLLGGKDIMGEAGGGDPCPAALVRAREGAP